MGLNDYVIQLYLNVSLVQHRFPEMLAFDRWGNRMPWGKGHPCPATHCLSCECSLFTVQEAAITMLSQLIQAMIHAARHPMYWASPNTIVAF